MTDLDAIRARHDGTHMCYRDGRQTFRDATWNCDTAIVLAALDAALARERRLREAIIAAVNDAADIRLPDGTLAIRREHAVQVITYAEPRDFR